MRLELCLVLAGAALCGCRTIPDFEVLEQPKSIEQYTPGKAWLSGVGTTDPVLALCKTNQGLGRFSLEKAHKLNLALSVPVIKWVSGALGLDHQSTFHVAWTNLQDVYIVDAYQLKTVDPVLWEAIVASNLSMTISNSTAENVGVDIVASNLTAGLQGNINFTVTNSGGSGFIATSDKPLVTAIRVVKPLYDVAVKRTSLDLSQLAKGKTQQAGFGYLITVSPSPGSVDALKQAAELHIDNPGIPQFQGTNVVFTGANPWVNDNRNAIARIDRRAAHSEFVWDKMSLEWDGYLTNCACSVTRQYISVKPVKSGLEGTR
jgi:hypothetical protein